MYWKVTIENWNELKEVVDKLNDFVFRGQKKSKWGLSPKLERDTCGIKAPARRYHFENEMIKEFKRYAPQHIHNLPEDEDLFGWLSILQHHGASTRLLDFSQSLYVATFFAVEEQKTKSAIWAVNKSELAINTIKNINDPKIIKDSKKSVEPIDDLMRSLINKELSYANGSLIDNSERDNKLAAAEPKYLHERLVVQQGVFLLAFNLEIGFEKVLGQHLELESLDEKFAQEKAMNDIKNLNENSSAKVIKFILPKNVGLEALTDLRLMNITSATLFPGFDGFVKSLNYILKK